MALTDKLTAIADAIRAKTGGTAALTLAQMPTEIDGIETGGSGGSLQTKTVYPSHSEQVITPDEDYYGLVSVTVKPTPRLPAFALGVASDNEISAVATPLLEFGDISVGSAHQETVIEDIPYSTHTGWFPSGSTIYSSTDPVVTYSFPVESGLTYTISMTEIGNRLRCAFTTVDPSTITGDMGNSLSEYQDLASYMVAGYEFTYTATMNGWYLVYVSNQDERPTISIKTTKTVWVNDE